MNASASASHLPYLQPRPHLALAVDGHSTNNLGRGEKKDSSGHPEQPSDFACDECYEAALLLLVRGRRITFLTFDGERGRGACVAFVKKHGGRASPISQDTLRHLGLGHLCLITDLCATNGGSIFLLFVDGLMVLVLLRPSIGSYAFLEYKRHGKHGLVSST